MLYLALPHQIYLTGAQLKCLASCSLCYKRVKLSSQNAVNENATVTLVSQQNKIFIDFFGALSTQDTVRPGNKYGLILQFNVFSSIMYVGTQQTIALLLS